MKTPFTRLHLRSGLLALMLVLVSAFSDADTLRNMNAHVVVQFTEGVLEPNAPEFIENLAVRVGAPLAYVRPSGVNGHLILIRHLNGATQFEQVMSKLNTDQLVVSAHQRGTLEPERR